MQKSQITPRWVSWGIWKAGSRRLAMMIFTSLLVLSVVLVLAGLMFKGYGLFFSPIFPIWYGLAVRWMDKNTTWAE